MSGIFRKVMCSDRLPEKDGDYVVFSKCDTNSTYAYADTLIFKNGSFKEVPDWTTLWWLEEIELPSEENKQAIVKEWYKDQQFKSNYPAQPSSFMAGFNKAIELIEGYK